jgi:hypothetical protein
LNLDATGFGFAIPATAMIAGITASVERGTNPGANAVQTISETGSPTAGTFTITGTPPGGTARTSVSLARTAPATGTSSVQTALEGIYGVGNVTCSGGPLPVAVPCTFAGAYASMPVATMTFTKTGFLPSGATPVITVTTAGYTPALQDNTVQLLKLGSPVGSNKALGTTWGLPDTAIGYGSTSDFWGTTWTPADVNATNFGLRFTAKNTGASSSTATVDFISITVTYIQAAQRRRLVHVRAPGSAYAVHRDGPHLRDHDHDHGGGEQPGARDAGRRFQLLVGKRDARSEALLHEPEPRPGHQLLRQRRRYHDRPEQKPHRQR